MNDLNDHMNEFLSEWMNKRINVWVNKWKNETRNASAGGDGGGGGIYVSSWLMDCFLFSEKCGIDPLNVSDNEVVFKASCAT